MAGVGLRLTLSSPTSAVAAWALAHGVSVLGTVPVEADGSAYFELPVVPTVLGFDPRVQFVHQDDVVGAWRTVREELKAYGEGLADKPEILALNKIDALDSKTRKARAAAT